VGACFGDDGAAVGVADQHDRAILSVEDPSGGGGIAFQRQGGVLNDADPEAVAGERFVDTLPARAVDESAVDENDITHRVCGHDDPFCSEVGECQNANARCTRAAYVI
jgi:hypothetical protein